MNIHASKKRMGRGLVIFISLVSLLSIAAGLMLEGGTIFLPLVIQQSSSPTPTATTAPVTTAEPTPPGTPAPPPTIQLIVNPEDPDREWALAYFAKSYNKSGRPVMEIYPGDSSAPSARIKLPSGEIVAALEDPVTADGGGKFWELVDHEGKDGETLFLRAQDVTKVTLTEPD